MSGFLLDTNIPSELVRSRPHPRVEHWFFSQHEPSLFLSAVTIGELRKGFVLLQAGPRRAQLERWLESSLVPRFQGRILSVTHAIANRWGALDGQCQLKGAPLNTADGMIAATALVHSFTVVTRNVKDFEGLGVTLLNPWASP